MDRRTGAMLLALVGGAVCAECRASDLDAIRALIGPIKVRIDHEEKLERGADPATPPRKSESWT